MSMPMLAGVGLLVVCCSSSSAMMMMGGGGEETPAAAATGAGAGAGAGADATVEPIMLGESTLPDAADATIVEPGCEWSRGTVIEPPNESNNKLHQGDEPPKKRNFLGS